jgi:hypothetical protein
MHTYTIFKINENVYNSKIPPIAYKKLLLNLFKNISYFELLVKQFR